MKEKKLIKLRFEYDNGDTAELSGKDAQKWQQCADVIFVFAQNHGYDVDLSKLKWKRTEEKK